jgi:hypothetical protein
VNAGVPKIPYPWLVFNEKVKVNSVFLRDSTGVSDSVLLLFGGNIEKGGLVSFLMVFLFASPPLLFLHPFLCFLLLKLSIYFDRMGT